MTNEMTVEEAIKWLKDIERSFSETYFGEWRKALRMAIKALEQQPCEDAVSREQAIFIVDEYAIGGETWAQRKDCVELLKQLPSVNPKQEVCEDAVSREAVLHLYKTFWRCFVDDENADIFMNAIRDLPSITPRRDLAETSQDCISREEVQDLISRWLSDYLLDETREALETINYKIGDMPSVTPERPKGKWIEIEIDAGEFIYKCTKCGMRVINPYKYCPNCGAEMGGEEDG